MDVKKWIAVLSQVKGVDGFVLGGSKSRGEEDFHSDTDIGIYYQPSIDWKKLENALKVLMDETRVSEKVLYLPGEWGPWVNGGAWLKVDGEPYDVILRDTTRTATVIGDCMEGKVTIDFQAGHPFGFVNTIYAAEIHYADVLWERDGQPLTKLKELLPEDGKLPPKMKEAVIRRFLFEAEFSMETARKAAFRDDVHYAVGCFFRTAGSWNQVLYALNDRYLMNEKSSTVIANHLPICPVAYFVRVHQTYEYLATHKPGLALDEYERLHEEILQLVEYSVKKD